ncbi:MAG: nuclear transport factor 2 family protein [Bacteroidota bacterium]
MTTYFLLACSLLTTATAHTAAVDDEAVIRAVIEQFAEGADAQQSARVAEVLHAEAQQFFQGPNGLVRLTHEAYINMLDAKQIGGSPRTLVVHNVDVNGNLAVASVTMQGEQAHFENYIALMKTDGGWQIVSVILRMETM